VSRLRVVTAAEFAAVDELDAEPLLGDEKSNVLPAAGLTVFWGAEGAGKTTLVLDMACHMAAGKPWLSIGVPRPVRVLVVENEGPRGPFPRKVRAKLEHWRR
jgi:RecA-family ATPase